jgi:flavin-dependent dehydrogenase
MRDVSERIAALSAGQRDLLLRKFQAKAEERNREPEIVNRPPATAPEKTFDVVVLGGGLAGQTLARQLKRARPSLSVLVTELRAHPVRESAHKVGESTVEIGGHYFSKVLGLEPHMKSAQLRKAGLRYFFQNGNNEDVAERVEMGATFFPPVPGYQLDRGRLENTLREENAALGVEFRDRCKAVQVTRDGGVHYTGLECEGEAVTVASRWVVDASGRAGLLKRQLGLAREVGHKCNSVWFRLGERIDIDEWSQAPHWRERVREGLRWLSTNHFMGRGYWVWFIPLAPGATSVGIVADADMHPLEEMRSFDLALEWLKRHEPQCARAVEQRRDKRMDFLAIRNYAYGCSRVFSSDRWALTGEAGVFSDPFYSPGSDFIGMANTFITNLILRDFDGEAIAERAREYDRIYLNTFESFLTVYEKQYGLMGNPRVMPAKIVWDFAIYWGFLTLQFLGGRLCDLDLTERAGQDLQRVNHLNARMQVFFREWDALDQRPGESAFIDVLGIDIMRRFHFDLLEELPGEALVERFSRNLRLMESLAAAIFREAAQCLPGYRGEADGAVNPYAITLNRGLWEEEKVFDREKAVEVEEIAAATMASIRLEPAAGSLRMDVAHAG